MVFLLAFKSEKKKNALSIMCSHKKVFTQSHDKAMLKYRKTISFNIIKSFFFQDSQNEIHLLFYE